MSVYATTWAWEHSQAKGPALLVLLAIADTLNRETGRAWLSMTELQHKARLARSTVNTALITLRKLGEIESIEGENGPKGRSVYRMPGFQPELPAPHRPATSTGAVPVTSTAPVPPPQYGSATSTGNVLVREPDSTSTGAVPPLVREPYHPYITEVNGRTEKTTTARTPPANAQQLPLVEGLPDPPETEGQRVNRLARTYTDRVPLSKFVAVAGVVRAAVRAGHSDEQITIGLARIAQDKRAVTVDSLRIAIEAPNGPKRHTPWRNTFTDADYLNG